MQLKPIESLTNEEIKRLLEIAEDVAQYFEQVKKKAIERLRNGETINGYDYEPIRGYKLWDRTRYEEITEKIKEIVEDKKLYNKLFKFTPQSFSEIKKILGERAEELAEFLQERKETYKLVSIKKNAEIFNEI